MSRFKAPAGSTQPEGQSSHGDCSQPKQVAAFEAADGGEPPRDRLGGRGQGLYKLFAVPPEDDGTVRAERLLGRFGADTLKILARSDQGASRQWRCSTRDQAHQLELIIGRPLAAPPRPRWGLSRPCRVVRRRGDAASATSTATKFAAVAVRGPAMRTLSMPSIGV
jgi:hypothetical protein